MPNRGNSRSPQEMMFKKHLLIVNILVMFIVGSCSIQPFEQHLEVDNSLRSFAAKVDSVVVNNMNTYNIPGLSIGIINGDSVVFLKGYGVRNINTNEAVNRNTTFHTASISKLFTAQAIMILIQENKLGLDTKLIEIIPELRYKDERVTKITIKSLLNHTSGLPDVGNYHWNNNNQSDHSLRDYILSLNIKLQSEPHAEYHYSNLGYNILGYVIERLTDTNFDLFIKENILIPSKMLNSDFRYFKIADSLKASPHAKRRISNKPYVRKIYPYTREQAPGSTLNSSANDLSKWMMAFLKSNVETNADYDYSDMFRPSFGSYPYIGLGFQLGKIDSKVTIGHFGGDIGFRSYLIMIPEEKIGLVVLANCDYEEDFRQEILHSIAKLMLTNDHID